MTVPKSIKENRCIIASAGFFVLWVLLQFDPIHSLGAKFVQSDLTNENIEYLEAAEAEARDRFVKLSEIFAVLKVIESSEIGIDFLVKIQVEFGQTLAALSDVVERSAEVALAAGAAAVALKALVHIAELMSPLLFKTALLFAAIYFLAISAKRGQVVAAGARAFCEIFVVLFLTVYLLIPYTIHATGWLSQRVMVELVGDSGEQLASLHEEVTHTQTQDADQSTSRNGEKKVFAHHARHAIRNFERIVVQLPHKLEMMGLYLVRHAAASTVEGVIFPLGIFLALWFGMRRILRRIAQFYSEFAESLSSK